MSQTISTEIFEQQLSAVDSEAMKMVAVFGIEQNLRAIHAEAILIVEQSSATGDIDFSDTESLFESMQEIAGFKYDESYVIEELRELYRLCKLTADVPSLVGVEDLNGSTGLPADCEDLPQAVIDCCLGLRALDDAIKGVGYLANASVVMNSVDRAKFAAQLSELLMRFDLLGEESIEGIFSQLNQSTIINAVYVTDWAEGRVETKCTVDIEQCRIVDIDLADCPFVTLESEFVQILIDNLIHQIDAVDGEFTDKGIAYLKKVTFQKQCHVDEIATDTADTAPSLV